METMKNTAKGKRFQKEVQKWFSLNRNEKFNTEVAMPIGFPAKLHKFDLVNESATVFVECKNYTWTASGNIPSAKLAFCNEAIFLLRLLPATCEKWLVMVKSTHPKRTETLAEYYCKTYKHLFGDVKVAEYDCENHMFTLLSLPEEGCVVCGMGFTMEQLDNTSEEEFAVFRMNHMPKKLYKYFPDSSTIQDDKKINYSREALVNNTVFLQTPERFDDPYDSSIVVDETEFHRHRLLHYLAICKIEHDAHADNNTLMYQLAQGIYARSVNGTSFEELYAITPNLEEIDSLRRTNFALSLAEKLQKYQTDVDAWQHAIYDALHNEFITMQNSLVKHFRVSCFATSPYSMLMWSHYANSHKGFCVEYEIPEYGTDDDLLLHRLYPVIYSSRRTSVLDACLQEMDSNKNAVDTLWKIHKYGLLSKDIIWQYQNEWRLVGYDKAMEVDGSYNYKFFKISKVYLGNKMDAATRKEIISICKKKGIPYVGVQTVNDRYAMQDCPYLCENCPNKPIV